MPSTSRFISENEVINIELPEIDFADPVGSTGATGTLALPEIPESLDLLGLLDYHLCIPW